MNLGRELSKPIDPNMTSIDYVPTQYLTELIRTQGYDGIIYPSALGKNGTKNIVLFSERNVECQDVTIYEVDDINVIAFRKYT